MNKNERLAAFPELIEGTAVFSQNQHRLGTVTAIGDEGFVIERNFFFPLDYAATYGDIDRVEDGKLILRQGLDELPGWSKDYAEAGISPHEQVTGIVDETIPTIIVTEPIHTDMSALEFMDDGKGGPLPNEIPEAKVVDRPFPRPPTEKSN